MLILTRLRTRTRLETFGLNEFSAKFYIFAQTSADNCPLTTNDKIGKINCYQLTMAKFFFSFKLRYLVITNDTDKAARNPTPKECSEIKRGFSLTSVNQNLMQHHTTSLRWFTAAKLYCRCCKRQLS